MYIYLQFCVLIVSLFNVATQGENVITTKINILSIESIML